LMVARTLRAPLILFDQAPPGFDLAPSLGRAGDFFGRTGVSSDIAATDNKEDEDEPRYIENVRKVTAEVGREVDRYVHHLQASR